MSYRYRKKNANPEWNIPITGIGARSSRQVYPMSQRRSSGPTRMQATRYQPRTKPTQTIVVKHVVDPSISMSNTATGTAQSNVAGNGSSLSPAQLVDEINKHKIKTPEMRKFLNDYKIQCQAAKALSESSSTTAPRPSPVTGTGMDQALQLQPGPQVSSQANGSQPSNKELQTMTALASQLLARASISH